MHDATTILDVEVVRLCDCVYDVFGECRSLIFLGNANHIYSIDRKV
uniref:G-protein coupled receptors family 1 profile domain-containing protein n=1 Tax=Parascaris univalens TaxID=6257 RepID=A0A914ZHY1_PARUN